MTTAVLKMKILITTVQNNDQVLSIELDRDDFAQQRTLSAVLCNSHDRRLFELKTLWYIKWESILWIVLPDSGFVQHCQMQKMQSGIFFLVCFFIVR